MVNKIVEVSETPLRRISAKLLMPTNVMYKIGINLYKNQLLISPIRKIRIL